MLSAKTRLIACCIRILSEKTGLVPRPDPLTEFVNSIFGVEPFEVQAARNVEASLEKAAAAARRARTNREFKKVTQDF